MTFVSTAQDPERVDFQAEDQPDAEEDDPLGPLKQANATPESEPLCSRPRVADHQRSDRRGVREELDLQVASERGLDKDAQEDRRLGVAIERRVEERAKRGRPLRRARQRPVEHVESARDEDQEASEVQVPERDNGGDAEVEQAADSSQYVRADASAG